MEDYRNRLIGRSGCRYYRRERTDKISYPCKDYQGNVGNGAVQEVHAAKSFYQGSLAAIVCTKDYTKSARALAKNVGVSLWHVSDLDKL